MNVLYFAWVRQKVGRSDEVIEHGPSLRTVGDLALLLASRGGGYAEAFADLRRLRAAVNQHHVGMDAPLAAGDEVAFFPPVTGG
ncbi:MAG: molybdopterin converting factor subunit 1 [Alphaproteobacteria bacterium]|nr:molybdopterin converting factor subunit 1 [Alphaproteobacteria bacterium]MBL7097987.1 molybdopterin converting factor subunit 1 [Alphaproteobacteria bacterium]